MEFGHDFLSQILGRCKEILSYRILASRGLLRRNVLRYHPL